MKSWRISGVSSKGRSVIDKVGEAMIQFIPVQNGCRSFLESPGDASGCQNTGKGAGCVISVGHSHVCVLSFEDGLGGGDDTGLRIAAAAAGSGILMPEIEDGVVRMRAAHSGLLRVEREAIIEIHSLGGMRIDILTHGLPVVKYQLIAEIWFESGQAGNAGLSSVEEICHRCSPIIDVLPFRESKIGLLIFPLCEFSTALSEVIATLRRRISDLGSVVVGERILSDGGDADAALRYMCERDAEMLIMVGVPDVENCRLSGQFGTAGGKPAVSGQALLVPASRDGGNGLVPVLGLSESLLHDRGLVVDVLVPRFLAGVHEPSGENGRE